MRLKQHPRYPAFEAWFRQRLAAAHPLKGEYYRVAGPRYTTVQDIVSGIGARNGGGRWNPPDAMRAVYASSTPETATAESLAHYRYYKLPLSSAMPKVIVSLDIAIDAVLDISSAALQSVLPVRMPTLLAEDWRAVMQAGNEATTQAMGRAAFEAGLHGLVVPSDALPRGVNLLIFPQRLSGSFQVRVQNSDELEKLGKPA